ncbi:flagellar biosynthesis protein FlhF [Clostridium sp. BJN0001]|uniref:flagellar biosynthesis protein FlhF n=1 Tax=Clostridium sp. BJN0001 TaxID=2930219 RepID=UPI001FD5F41B|nr:flagellar biosynthesis protein FlhF [Clostridium sp. BJN0001]
MIIKKYVANEMNEAMLKIRSELGKDAVIISQRKIRKKGIKGIFGGKLIEVTAAVENSNKEKKKKYQFKAASDKEFEDSVLNFQKIMKNNFSKNDEEEIAKEKEKSDFEKMIEKHNNKAIKETTEKKEITAKNDDKSQSYIESVHKEVSEIKDLLNKAIVEKNSNQIKSEDKDENNSLYKEFQKLDIDEEYINDLIDKVKNIKENSEEKKDPKEILSEALKEDINISSDDLEGNVVLVGPTGVGKTTTIAKLAGRLSLVEKKRVGLITVDTYRIGAVDQLKTYAEIMNIPFEVVITAKEMEQAVEKMSNLDVVLIDTTGRSSKNIMQISELRTFITKTNPSKVEMVISSTTKNSDIKSILKGYEKLDYNNIIITKLDETTTYGCIYNICKEAEKPIQYMTIGQNVPDDMKVPEKDEIIRLILGEETI